jgi:class 3 adenylate cyclase
MITNTQVPERFRTVINDQITIYNQGRSIQQRNTIPDTNDIPLDDRRHWLKIPDVICVYVDMVDSTRLSATTQDRSTAGAYQLFTDTAVRLFDQFDAPYIDVRGDGVFALFDSDQPYRALAAAVTFRTFVDEEFVHRLKNDTGLDLGVHSGIDQKTVLVKRLGMRRHANRTDRQNEVWAGKPVNMAAKLASKTNHKELLVSARFFQHITHERARKSCGCPNGTKLDLWTTVDLTGDQRFDFTTAHQLGSIWCKHHGAEYCDTLLTLDEQPTATAASAAARVFARVALGR